MESREQSDQKYSADHRINFPDGKQEITVCKSSRRARRSTNSNSISSTIGYAFRTALRISDRIGVGV
jgi:hypothetical protein